MCVCVVQQIVECLVGQSDLHQDMIGRKQAVRQRYVELQQELDERLKLRDETRLDGLRHIQQYVSHYVLTTAQPSYLHHLITVQPHRSTRSSSVITLFRPPSASSL